MVAGVKEVKMLEEQNGILSLENDLAECKISLWGGQIISYRPKKERQDVFWLGDLNAFDEKSAIRGGIPVCWPRFAAEEINNNLPRHGFARISNWCLQSAAVKNDKIKVALSLLPDKKYDIKLSAKLFVTITDKLECCLETVNSAADDVKFSEAMHAYFKVGNRDEIIIKGLAKYSYKNASDGKIYVLNDDLKINGEFDAAFINHRGVVEIEDKVFHRTIKLEKRGSNSTVIWNPNKDLPEMSKGEYKHFVCVEPANQGDAFVVLKPKQKHRITMTIAVES